MAVAFLELAGVRCAYSAHPVLDGVSFSIPAGAFVGIIGPNGSGKTTLLRTIARVLPLKEGQLSLNGHPLAAIPSRQLARQLALVGQEAMTGFDFAVSEVVSLGRLPYQDPWGQESQADREAVRQALALTGTSHLAARPLNSLSEGERQRVMIARALAQEPAALLLDEPTSHLDIGHQVEILTLLSRLNQEKGVTVLAVFHDLNLAAAWCRTLILLHQGQLSAMGSPAEVLHPDRIRAVYGTEVLVLEHPYHGNPYVLPSAPPPLPADACPPGPPLRVHVICGGGMGGSLLRQLVRYGHHLSAGVLNRGDGDWQVARLLGVEVVEEDPFSPISAAAEGQATSLALAAQAVVVAALPVGPGNLANLRVAICTARAGVPVFVLSRPDPRERDFTGGEAITLFRTLRETGARFVASERELLAGLTLVQTAVLRVK